MSLALTSSQIVSAALAAGGADAAFDPVQVQHLLFLIDRTIPDQVAGPHFAFAPGPFGPFDETVTEVVVALCHEGCMRRRTAAIGFHYALTARGLEQGSGVLSQLEASVTGYLGSLVAWIQALDFRQRLDVIQARYPDMVPERNGSISPPLGSKSARRRLVQAYARRPSLGSFGRGFAHVTDLRGVHDYHDRILRALREAREETTSLEDVWTAVGDDIREAMALYMCGEEHSLSEHEPSRIA